jgi:cell wall-associated NlpC family hydrolase
VNTLRSHIRSTLALALAVVLSVSIVSPAFASVLTDKRAQAAAAQTQIAALTVKQETAIEQFNSARDTYDAATAQVDASKARIAKLKAQTATLQTALGNQADEMYRENGTFGFLAALFSARSFEDLNSTIELIQRISEQNAATVAQLKATELAAAAEERNLVVAQASAAADKSKMAANEQAVHAQLAQSQQLYASLSADIKKILAQQAAAEAAAARARYLALIGSRGSGGSASFDPGGNPPTSSKGAAAVWWAEKALGRPYQWGAAGPNSFDCSGLVKWAYGHVGIDLPHYSGAQIGVGARVARANLEPGDLVFFGSPIHHVGMYIGGGDFIEAPYTGANVRIATLGNRYDYAGACRP